MKNIELLMSFYSTSLERWAIKNIKSIVCLFDGYVEIESMYFNIPGKNSKSDKRLTYNKFASLIDDESFDQANGMFFNSKNNVVTGSINISEQFGNLDIGIQHNKNNNIETINKLLINISKLLKSDLSLILQTNIRTNISIDCAYGAHDKGIGIKAGLRDVYWVNYYGNSFAELIGKEKLLDLPVSEAKAVGEGVYFKLTEEPEDAFALKNAIKAQIGEQYFVPKDIKGKKHMANTKEKSGLFGVFSHLLHLSKTPENLLVAESRPDFNQGS